MRITLGIPPDLTSLTWLSSTTSPSYF